MYVHNINPVLVDFGFAQIRWYGLFYAVFLIIAFFMLPYVAKKRKVELSRDDLQMYLLGIFLAGIIGARIAYFIANEPQSLFTTEFFAIWNGGVASYGGIFAAVLFAYLYAKKKKINMYRLMDATAVTGALLPCFIRAGNFMNGEIPGLLASVPWAVKFPGYDGFRHPFVLYALAVNIIVFLAFWKLKNKEKLHDGILFWGFLAVYSFDRFFLDFFRQYDYYIFGLSSAQWISIPLFIVSAFFIIRIFKSHRKITHEKEIRK